MLLRLLLFLLAFAHKYRRRDGKQQGRECIEIGEWIAQIALGAEQRPEHVEHQHAEIGGNKIAPKRDAHGAEDQTAQIGGHKAARLEHEDHGEAVGVRKIIQLSNGFEASRQGVHHAFAGEATEKVRQDQAARRCDKIDQHRRPEMFKHDARQDEQNRRRKNKGEGFDHAEADQNQRHGQGTAGQILGQRIRRFDGDVVLCQKHDTDRQHGEHEDEGKNLQDPDEFAVLLFVVCHAEALLMMQTFLL